jgi:hypothetical protein
MERVAYLFMIAILILLIAVLFGVLGKGEYKPPAPSQGYVSNNSVLVELGSVTGPKVGVSS